MTHPRRIVRSVWCADRWLPGRREPKVATRSLWPLVACVAAIVASGALVLESARADGLARVVGLQRGDLATCHLSLSLRCPRRAPQDECWQMPARRFEPIEIGHRRTR